MVDEMKKELSERIALNAVRLAEPYYQIENVFQSADADWKGDKEGRALLAFMSHYRMNGTEIPCREQMLRELSQKTNKYYFFGEPSSDTICEQTLSGHSWLLRGLCEHYEVFHDAFSMEALLSVTEHLYLPLAGRFKTYPTTREKVDRGGVSGTLIGKVGDWMLSSDVGCAFMSIDGLSHVYLLTKDSRLKALLDEMITVYLAIDKASLRVQTHCTLTAARGMVRMYKACREPWYLDGAKVIFDLYVNGGGMTYTYQNLNWWGRPNTWTEPCAIVDSMMLAGELYKLTGENAYRRYAARFFHNGLATAERNNGGAGTDAIVCAENHYIFMRSYEAPFCCTMRLAEGLRYVYENEELFVPERTGTLEKDENGVYHDGDIVYCEAFGGEGTLVDGHLLAPIPKFYRMAREEFSALRLRVVFPDGCE